MSAIPENLRRHVVERVGGCCKYCLVPIEGQVAWFPIDHIIPRSRDGNTELDNLCLSCPRCNEYKWARDLATDPTTGEEVALFNPRTQQWTEYFRWSTSAPDEIDGITPCGRGTVARLKMNDPEIVNIRRWLSELGIQFGPRH